VRRRSLLALFGGAAAALPWTGRAQQQRRIGLLCGISADTFAPLLAALRRGLDDTGYAEGRNLQIEYRWAEDDAARLPALAADLVRAKVEVIVTGGGPHPVSAAMRATPEIPIVASAAGNFVEHFNRPEGNLTGIGFLTGSLMPKQLELLVELVRGAAIAVLANPAYFEYESQRKQIEEAARVLGVDARFLLAGTDAELEPAFASLAKLGAAALLISADPFFNSQRQRLVALAARYTVPTMHEWRESVAAGGLISYGPSLTSVYRLLGTYVGKILEGAKPGDLPVQQPTRFELAVNLKTAQALGLTVPPSILARADEVIE
jgi:putative ABC transport system substrate-binding protein